MCGILGFVSENGHNLPDTNSSLASLAHRGPDGNGEQTLNIHGKTVWLGHTRLSILDLSQAGAQPMASRDGRWHIVFNGEIYNHLELRKQLSGPFRGHSDTETLIELIAKNGVEKTLPQLNGMFAFAAVDTVDGLLYLVRDPFGIKPIYYTQREGCFAFASEARALKAMGVAEPTVDTEALRTFLALRYVPSPKTLFDKVQRLPPGHVYVLQLSSEKVRLQRYVKPTTDHFKGSLVDAADAYQEMLRAAVGRQLLSDVPVGVLLSGGIDSAIVAAMAKDLGSVLPGFTVGFHKDDAESEIEDASITAQVLGLPFHPITVTPDQLLDVLPSIVSAIEEPLGTTSIMPMWLLVKEARKHVTVVLTGQGNDEPWGGYRRYQIELIRQLLPMTGFWRHINNAANQIDTLPDALERGLRTLPEKDINKRILEASALFAKEERKALMGDDSDGIALAAISEWLRWLEVAKITPVEQMMRLDTRMNLADDLLLYGDKISMAVSLEARVPMLDIELMHFVESLPLNYRVSLSRTKIVHKYMAKRYLPPTIVNRKKKGFQVPFGKWSRGPWRDYMEATLFDVNSNHLQFLDKKVIEHIWMQHVHQKPDRSRQVFSLLSLALWFQN